MERMALFKNYLEDFSRIKPEVASCFKGDSYAWYDSINEIYGFSDTLNMSKSDSWVLYMAVHEAGHSWTVNRLMDNTPIYLIMCSIVITAFLATLKSPVWIIWLIAGMLSVIVETRIYIWNEKAAEKFVQRLLGPGFRLSMSLEVAIGEYGVGDISAWRYADMLHDLKELDMEYWRD